MLSTHARKFLIIVGSCLVLAVFFIVSIHLLTGSRLTAQQASANAGTHTAPVNRGDGFTQPEPINFDDHDGWVKIFDGKTLNGWDGSPEVWHVEDGAIVGESNPAHPSGTTNIIWRGGEPANFELKVEMKLEGSGANGGIQYRSVNAPATPQQELTQRYAKWNMKGYQADFDYANSYTGQLYEQDSRRGIIAWRGQMVETDQGKEHRLLATLDTSDGLKAFIKPGDWNQYEVIADGKTLIHLRLLLQPRVVRLSDERYREAALQAAITSAPTRCVALVDMVIRLILDDVNVRKHALLTFNYGDFGDLCRKHQIEMV